MKKDLVTEKFVVSLNDQDFSLGRSDALLLKKKSELIEKEKSAEINMECIRKIYSENICSLEAINIFRDVIRSKTKKSVFDALEKMIKYREEVEKYLQEKQDAVCELLSKNKNSLAYVAFEKKPVFNLNREKRFCLNSFEKDTFSYKLCFNSFICQMKAKEYDYVIFNRLENYNKNCYSYKSIKSTIGKDYVSICSSDFRELDDNSKIIINGEDEDKTCFIRGAMARTYLNPYDFSKPLWHKEIEEYSNASSLYRTVFVEFQSILSNIMNILKLKEKISVFGPTKLSLGDRHFYVFVDHVYDRSTSYSYDISYEYEKEQLIIL
jgi:hypothetical protein